MRSFQKKRKWRNVLHSRPVLFFLIILLLFFAWGVFRFTGKMQETSRNKKIAENKINELQQVKEKLSSDIAKLKTDQGIEESIRQKFGLAKEGEEMIVVVEDKNAPAVQPTPPPGFWSWLFFWRK